MDILDLIGISKLSNSEIATPQKVIDEMVALLPDEVFKPETTFLDPACKSGRYLISLKNKLMNSPKMIKAIPDEKARLKHILENQLYGLATSTTTALITTRALYGKLALNGNVTYIDNYLQRMADKNTNYKDLIKEAFGLNMTFDVVIGNPPYQMNTGSGSQGSGATALFDSFINLGIIVSSKIVCMITPTKWISGTQTNMQKLRKALTKDNHIKYMVDYMNGKDCFDNTSIAGGVSYFLYDKDYSGNTEFTTVLGKRHTKTRNLNLYDVIPRHAIADSVIEKIQRTGDRSIQSNIIKDRWKLPTNFDDGEVIRLHDTDIKLITPNMEYYIEADTYNINSVNKYKVMFTRVISEHAMEPSKDNMYTLLSSLSILKPYEICNASYMTLGDFSTETLAINAMNYMKTKFVRFLLLQTLFGIGLTSDRFKFVPMQDFSHPWTDEELYKKYNLTPEEINYIESTIKPMN